MSRCVMLVVDGLGLSGKTKALVDLAFALDPRVYRPVVVCFRDEGGPLSDALISRGIVVRVVPVQDRLSLSNLRLMLGAIRRERPDVVHCYNPRAILYGALAARLLGVKAVLGSLSAFACMVPDRNYDFLPQPLATRSLSNRLRNRFMALLVSKLAVVSEKLGKGFCEFNGISPARLRLVPYGVRTGEPPDSEARVARRELIRSQLGIGGDDLVVGSVGRLVEQKDYPTQFRGFALALRREKRLKMFLAGDGPLLAHLRALADELGIAGRVTFLGYRSDIAELFHAMDVFALASKFEPYGIAVLEAKANAVPIVCAAVNELPEILSHGKCGQLFEASSPQSFADALLKLVEDPGLRAQMAANAFREAQERHGLAAMIKSYERLYDELCQGAHT